MVEDAGLADRGDGGRVVDEADADDVLVDADLGRGLDVDPALVAGGDVEGVDERRQGFVTALHVAGDGRGVLDFLEAEDVDVEAVDGGHDLGLLVGEGGLGPGAADRAVVGADRGAVHVGVGAAAVLVLAQGGEVVENVEGGHGVLALDGVHRAQFGGPGLGPGDRQVGGGVVAGDRLGRLEAPEVVVEVDDDRVLEAHGVTGADGLVDAAVDGEVGQRGGLVGAAVVAGAAVVQGDEGCVVLGLQCDGRLARQGDVGRRAQWLGARGQADLTVGVQRVVVGDGVLADRQDEHVLECLAGLVTGWEGVDLQRGGRGEGGVGKREAGGAELGDLVVFLGGAGDDDGVADGRVGAGGSDIDEDRRGGDRDLGTRAGLLDDVAVHAALGVDGGDHTLGGDLPAEVRGGRAVTLNLGDGELLRRRIRLRDRIVAVPAGGAGRGGGADGEVGGVVVGVDAGLDARDRGGVARACGRGGLELRRGAPADQVDDGALAIAQLGHGLGAGEVEGAGLIRGRQSTGGVGAGLALDQVGGLRRDGAVEGVGGAGVAGRGLLVDDPPGDVDVGVGRVVQLDEITAVDGAGVAAASVDLVDDDVVALRGGERGGRGKQGGGRAEGGGDGDGGGAAAGPDAHGESFGN